jgi:hypothetical protein
MYIRCLFLYELLPGLFGSRRARWVLGGVVLTVVPFYNRVRNVEGIHTCADLHLDDDYYLS